MAPVSAPSTSQLARLRLACLREARKSGAVDLLGDATSPGGRSGDTDLVSRDADPRRMGAPAFRL